jgi:two-component system sensor histidine kinase KdpD
LGRLYCLRIIMSGIAEPEDLFLTIVEHLGRTMERPVVLMLQRGGRLLRVAPQGWVDGLGDDVEVAAERLWNEEADRPIERTLASGWFLRTLRSGGANVGVLAMRDGTGVADFSTLRAFFDLLCDQAAVAIERAQLARAYEDARVRTKTESLREALLNSISHDLQTPLASIVGAVSALQSFEALYDSRSRGELIATIREEAERLHRIIANILDLTRIKAGEVSPRLEYVELADIINAALTRARRGLADHELDISIPADLPMMRLDLFLMEHAFVNLLENAAKYAPKGTRIVVTAREEQGSVVIDVTDSGIGIAANDLGRIFDRFVRAATTDARPAGTGLGLTICRAFVAANGGEVEAYSPGEGKGATFRVQLPIPEPSVSLDTAVRDE